MPLPSANALKGSLKKAQKRKDTESVAYLRLGIAMKKMTGTSLSEEEVEALADDVSLVGIIEDIAAEYGA